MNKLFIIIAILIVILFTGCKQLPTESNPVSIQKKVLIDSVIVYLMEDTVETPVLLKNTSYCIQFSSIEIDKKGELNFIGTGITKRYSDLLVGNFEFWHNQFPVKVWLYQYKYIE